MLKRKNENGKEEILLLLRENTGYLDGYYDLPGGHVDENEDLFAAMIREAKEELGIEISIDNIIDTFVVNRRNKSLLPYYDVYFEINNYIGEIGIR